MTILSQNRRNLSQVHTHISFIKDEEGQGMVEYGLIIGLVAIALVVGLGIFGDEILAVFTSAGSNLPGTPAS